VRVEDSRQISTRAEWRAYVDDFLSRDVEMQNRVIPTTVLACAVLLSPGLGSDGLQAQQGRAAAQQVRTLPYAHDDVEGFTKIFDGTALGGWDGDPRFWQVDNGAIVGVSTPQTPLEHNTFLIWRGGARKGVLRDFELKLEFRLLGGRDNSGVQVRSSVRPGAPHRWRLTGYQVDMDFNNNYTGMVYGEEAGGFVAPRGEITHVRLGRERPQNIGTLGNATELRGLQQTNAWNTLHIIFRGNTLINIVNGRITSIIIDDDLEAGGGPRLAEGLIGLQLHSGPPMRVEFRNIYLKEYPGRPTS
jgi:hypothetical protein